MIFNLTKKYPDLLDILGLNEYQRKEILRKIFDRDITDKVPFQFRAKNIRPTKKDGQVDLDTVLHHLTSHEIEVEENGRKFSKRVYESDRSQRLHWLRPHVDEEIDASIEVFSATERDKKKRKDVTRTYIYNKDEKYVVVLEPQRSDTDYYLLTAYHLNKPYSEKQMKKKMQKRLTQIV